MQFTIFLKVGLVGWQDAELGTLQEPCSHKLNRSIPPHITPDDYTPSRAPALYVEDPRFNPKHLQGWEKAQFEILVSCSKSMNRHYWAQWTNGLMVLLCSTYDFASGRMFRCTFKCWFCPFLSMASTYRCPTKWSWCPMPLMVCASKQKFPFLNLWISSKIYFFCFPNGKLS